MRLEDFKDGMIIRFNEGNPDAIVLNNGNDYMYFGKNGNEIHRNIFKLDNLYDFGGIDEAVESVYYMGELVWKNIKYVSFDEARKSGKMFKYKEWKYFYRLDEVMYRLWTNETCKINELLDSKEWEIED